MRNDYTVIHVHLTTAEKIAFLVSLGFEVKSTPVLMIFPVYHDDTEEETKEVMAVFKDGVPYHKPGGYSFGDDEWVNDVCDEELSKKLKSVLLGHSPCGVK